MTSYRFDLLRAGGEVFATHEIDYDTDEAAIAGGHLINEPSPIDCCFKVWRDRELVHWQCNGPRCSSCPDG